MARRMAIKPAITARRPYKLRVGGGETEPGTVLGRSGPVGAGRGRSGSVGSGRGRSDGDFRSYAREGAWPCPKRPPANAAWLKTPTSGRT
jgi:hypothetical protein